MCILCTVSYIHHCELCMYANDNVSMIYRRYTPKLPDYYLKLNNCPEIRFPYNQFHTYMVFVACAKIRFQNKRGHSSNTSVSTNKPNSRCIIIIRLICTNWNAWDWMKNDTNRTTTSQTIKFNYAFGSHCPLSIALESTLWIVHWMHLVVRRSDLQSYVWLVRWERNVQIN